VWRERHTTDGLVPWSARASATSVQLSLHIRCTTGVTVHTAHCRLAGQQGAPGPADSALSGRQLSSPIAGWDVSARSAGGGARAHTAEGLSSLDEQPTLGGSGAGRCGPKRLQAAAPHAFRTPRSLATARLPNTPFPRHLQAASVAWCAACLATLLYCAPRTSHAVQDLLVVFFQPVVPVTAALWLWGHNVQRFQALSIDYAACFAPKDRKYLLPAGQLYRVRPHTDQRHRQPCVVDLTVVHPPQASPRDTARLAPAVRLYGLTPTSMLHVSARR
jgi:hypothetical protein